MLTKEDLKQIGEVMGGRLDTFEKKMDGKFEAAEKKMEGKFDSFKTEIVLEIGEMLEENVLPQIESVKVRLDSIERRMDTEMVTKDYLDRKLGNLKGELVPIDRKLEAKTDALVGALERNKGLAPADVAALEASRVFPQSSQA